MFFTENTNNVYIIGSTYTPYMAEHFQSYEVETNLYSFEKAKKKRIYYNYYEDHEDYGITGEDTGPIDYLLVWYNKKNDNYYVLQFAHNIIIKNIFKDEEIYKLYYEAKNGFIYNTEDDKLKNSYLCILQESAVSDSVSIINLYEKKCIKYIDCGSHRNLNRIIQWNTKYIIATFYYGSYTWEEKKALINIIDLENEKIITKIEGKNINKIKYIKKINHPKYGESLLSIEEKASNIKLWII